MYIFWLAGLVVVTPAYNHFTLYGQLGDNLPLPTAIAISFRLMAVVIPVAWTVLVLFLLKMLRSKAAERRAELLLAFTLATLIIGLFVLLFFLLAGILPFLQIEAMLK
jgi:hypothetical protein